MLSRFIEVDQLQLGFDRQILTFLLNFNPISNFLLDLYPVYLVLLGFSLLTTPTSDFT